MPRSKKRGTSYAGAAAAVVVTAIAGSVATDPKTTWYRKLDKPSWQPPSWAFPVAWTALYASIAVASGKALADDSNEERRSRYKRSLLVNLALNAGWSYTFFKAHRLGLASVVAGLLAASSSNLAKQAGEVDPKLKIALTPYSAWTAFATALTTDIWKRNR